MQRHTDGFVLLKAIHNCFCNTEKPDDLMTYGGFIGHVRVRVHSKISRLNSEKYCCVSRKNMIRKRCTINCLDRISNSLHPVLYLRPFSSDTRVSSTVKWEAFLHDCYYPVWIRCSGLCNPKSEWLTTTKCISHSYSLSHWGAGEPAPCHPGSLVIL